MAMTVGTPVVGTTTLAAFVDLVYGNKTAALTGASATITPIELNKCVVSWSGYDEVLYITLNARQTGAEFIYYQ